ncbi:GPCR fungal pheromone mating factor [Amylostereum chailletii]|nr:GPCR fungal pheromone mating factor [Amylostereum chailletii]
MDPTYPLVPVANLLSAFLVFMSLLARSMRQSWNAGVWMLGLWLFVQVLTVGVDTIAWSDNLEDLAPIWCDIVSHLEVGWRVGIPACSLLTTRRLFRIIRLTTVEPPGRREKRYELLFDLFLGLGFPAVIMGLYWFVQGARYGVLEEYGCSSATILSGVSFIIVYAWAILFPFISAFFYTPRIAWRFFRHSREVNCFLHSNGSISRPRYIRYMVIGCVDFLVGVAMGFLPFWAGWPDGHDVPVGDPAHSWKTRPWEVFNIKNNEWSGAFLAVVYFLILGLTGEAREMYRGLFWAAVRPFGWTPSSDESNIASMLFERSDTSHTRESG